MNKNKHNIGYFTVIGLEYIKKMKIKKAYCDNCNYPLIDEEELMVIPFLDSAYCLECGERIIIDCKATGTNEEIYGMTKDFEYINMFI